MAKKCPPVPKKSQKSPARQVKPNFPPKKVKSAVKFF